jgi:exonuclease SbcC
LSQNQLKELNELYDLQQKKVQELTNAKIRLTRITAELDEKKLQYDQFSREDRELAVSTERKDYDITEIKKLRGDNEMLLKNSLDNKGIFEREVAVLSSRKENLEKDSKKISVLEICPVCKQQVNEEHKERISLEIKDEIKKINSEVDKKTNILDDLKKEIKNIEKEIDKINEAEKIAIVVNEKKLRKAKISEVLGLLNEQISKLKKAKETESGIVSQYSDLEKQLERIKSKIGEKQQQEKEILIEYSGLEQNKKDLQKEIKDLELEIENKNKIQEQMARFKEIQEFLTKNFSFVINSMEKQVMAHLRLEFNSLFRRWFSILVDSPQFDARIDQDFKPLISQAGYEVNYEYLSGGERTALALAYRLALNQVINSMLSKIATRGLLILDEPTDGFSSEQLDKMRSVLDELNTKQLILVSHEQKMEDFVEKVIRFTKQDHVSKASY